MDDKYKDVEKITETVNDYFLGMYEGDIERLGGAFAPEAQVIGYFQGNLGFLSRDQFLDFARNSPIPKEKGEAYDMKIVFVDITDTMAFVKVEDLYQGMWFTDYLSMIKKDDRWLIVNKTYYHK